MNGTNAFGQPGVYGTQYIASPANTPGVRYGAISWADKLGNLWLFGGEGSGQTVTDGYLNDLWRYSPATNQWTWFSGDVITDQPGVYGTKGTPSAGNQPGARTLSASWIDNAGNLWLFGGEVDISAGNLHCLNDLWKFSPSTNEWTWIGGSNTINQPGVYGQKGVPSAGNIPPSLYRATTWTDKNGNFWLFGGQNSSYQVLFDLWEYNPSTNEWTWLNGNQVGGGYPNVLSVYGTKKVPSPGNTPGPRIDATGWTDANNNLWLFGGGPGWNLLNDLWKYDITSNEWTWVSGDNVFDLAGVYGSTGIPSPANKPGSRYASTGWADNNGKLWLFGGIGLGSDPVGSSTGPLNDLWNYDIASDQWTWMAGGNTVNQPGIYGTKGTPSPANTPGGRLWANSWVSPDDRLWLFGGGGLATTPQGEGTLNDLWVYTPASLITVTSVSSTALCAGSGLEVTFDAQGAYTAGNVFTAQLSDAGGNFASPTAIGSITAIIGGTIQAIIPANTVAGSGYRVRVVSANPAVTGSDNGAGITIYGAITASITANGPTVICPGAPLTLAAAASGGAAPYQYNWTTGASSASLMVNPVSDTTYTVTITGNGCGIAKDSIRITMAAQQKVSLGGNQWLCPDNTLVLNAHNGYLTYQWQDGSSDSTFSVTQPGKYYVTVTNSCAETSGDTVIVTAAPAIPSDFIPADTAICSYNTLPVTPRYPFATYLWSTGQTTGTITVTQPGLYWLQVTDKYNCTARDSITVSQKSCLEGFRMPNAFTPNGDGKNDVLRPLLFGNVQQFRFMIFNRWGQKVFETTDLQKGWDGGNAANGFDTGVYVWTCQYQFQGQPVRVEKGTVVLIR